MLLPDLTWRDKGRLAALCLGPGATSSSRPKQTLHPRRGPCPPLLVAAVYLDNHVLHPRDRIKVDLGALRRLAAPLPPPRALAATAAAATAQVAGSCDRTWDSRYRIIG